MKTAVLLVLLALAPSAWADGWLSIGTGAIYIGAPESGRGDSRARGTGNLALTFSDHAAVRVRTTAFGYNGNSVVELAALVGFRMGKKSDGILLVGYSKLDDVSETEDNTNGAALELLYAPQRRGAVSYEISLHGNINDDHGFGGLLVAGRFGSMGKQPQKRSAQRAVPPYGSH